MKGVWQDGKRRHLFIGYLTTRKVAIGVELTLYRQARLGRGRRDQFEDHCVADERLPPPVLTDPRPHAPLHLFPFTLPFRQLPHPLRRRPPPTPPFLLAPRGPGRLPRRKKRLCLGIDRLELGITVRVVSSLVGLAIGLQTVPQVVQHLTDQLMGHLMALVRQFLGQLAQALARPTQRRLRVSPRQRFHQPFQILDQTGILAHRFLASASSSPNLSFSRSPCLLQFFDSMADGLARETRRS